MRTPEPVRFAEQWVHAWKTGDLEAVLGHYADDVIFTSPTAERIVPENAGTVRGKSALRSYWTLALEGNPDLHFGLEGVYAGVETIVLHYRRSAGQAGERGSHLRHGLVAVGHATHLQPAPT